MLKKYYFAFSVMTLLAQICIPSLGFAEKPSAVEPSAAAKDFVQELKHLASRTNAFTVILRLEEKLEDSSNLSVIDWLIGTTGFRQSDEGKSFLSEFSDAHSISEKTLLKKFNNLYDTARLKLITSKNMEAAVFGLAELLIGAAENKIPRSVQLLYFAALPTHFKLKDILYNLHDSLAFQKNSRLPPPRFEAFDLLQNASLWSQTELKMRTQKAVSDLFTEPKLVYTHRQQFIIKNAQLISDLGEIIMTGGGNDLYNFRLKADLTAFELVSLAARSTCSSVLSRFRK